MKELLDLHQEKMDKAIEEKTAAVKAANDARVAELEKEIQDNEAKIKQINTYCEALEEKQKFQAKKKEVVEDSITSGVKEMIESEKFKSAKNVGFKGKNNSTFEMKFDTGDITGTVNMTRQNRTINFDPERALAFMPNMRAMSPLSQDENRVLWVTGGYTSNVDYVGEGVAVDNPDEGTATEATRPMAKISARLPLTAEMFEDANYIAQALRNKMIERINLFTDREFYLGDGATAPVQHINGIVGEATPYVKPTGFEVERPNIGDLIDSCILQAENANQVGIDIVWMSPTDYMNAKKTKDDNGQYLFQMLPDGSLTNGMVRIVRSTAVPQNTMTVARASACQQWWKRNLEVKISQMNATNFIDDVYTVVGFLRCQGLIEDVDKTAVIHVDDIATAVSDLAPIVP